MYTMSAPDVPSRISLSRTCKKKKTIIDYDSNTESTNSNASDNDFTVNGDNELGSSSALIDVNIPMSTASKKNKSAQDTMIALHRRMRQSVNESLDQSSTSTYMNASTSSLNVSGVQCISDSVSNIPTQSNTNGTNDENSGHTPVINLLPLKGAHVFMDYYGKQGEIYKKHTIFGNSLIKLGAVVEKTFNRKVTIVLFRDGSQKTFDTAQERNIPLVLGKWVYDCETKNKFLDPKLYPSVKSNTYKDIKPRFYKKRVSESEIENNSDSIDQTQNLSNNNEGNPDTAETSVSNVNTDLIRSHLIDLLHDNVRTILYSPQKGFHRVNIDSLTPMAIKMLRKSLSPAPGENKTPDELFAEIKDIENRYKLTPVGKTRLRKLLFPVFEILYDLNAPAKSTLTKKRKNLLEMKKKYVYSVEKPCPKRKKRSFNLNRKDSVQNDEYLQEDMILQAYISGNTLDVNLDNLQEDMLLQASTSENTLGVNEDNLQDKMQPQTSISKSTNGVSEDNLQEVMESLASTSEYALGVNEDNLQEVTESLASTSENTLGANENNLLDEIQLQTSISENSSAVSQTSKGSLASSVALQTICCIKEETTDVIVLEALIRNLGKFLFQTEVTPSTTYVVSSTSRITKNTLDLALAIAYKCFIVSEAWVHDSYKNGKWMSHDPYLFLEINPLQAFQVQRNNLDPLVKYNIFKDVGFIHVAKECKEPSAKMLRRLVEAFGGQCTTDLSRASMIVGRRSSVIKCAPVQWIWYCIQNGQVLEPKNIVWE